MLNKSQRAKFFQAAKNNDLQTVRSFIEGKEGHPKLLENNDGQALVHIAARNGHLDIVKYVLESKPSTNSTKKIKTLYNHNLGLIDDAIFAGAIDIVEYLMDTYKVNLTATRDCDRVLFTTISYGQLNILKYFVEKNDLDVNMPCGKYSEPLIFSALRHKRSDTFKYLVEEKAADLKRLNYLDDNILFPIAEAGDLNTMKYILDVKQLDFDIDWTNCIGRTALYAAAGSNQIDIVRYLVEQKRADVNIPNYSISNTTCLHQAVSNNNYDMCAYLIAKGANVEDRSTYGRVKDERLTKLLEDTFMGERSRRSIFQPAFDERTLQPKGTTEDLFRRTIHLNGNVATTFGDIHYQQFQSFLMFTRLMIGHAKNFTRRIILSTPEQILRNRMDSVAEDAVRNVPSFMRLL